MFGINDLSRIKADLQNSLGMRVNLTAKKGRKKAIVRQGIIESTYSNIFVVKLDVTDEQIPSDRRVSYSYTDLLTKAVEISLENNKEANAVSA